MTVGKGRLVALGTCAFVASFLLWQGFTGSVGPSEHTWLVKDGRNSSEIMSATTTSDHVLVRIDARTPTLISFGGRCSPWVLDLRQGSWRAAGVALDRSQYGQLSPSAQNVKVMVVQREIRLMSNQEMIAFFSLIDNDCVDAAGIGSVGNEVTVRWYLEEISSREFLLFAAVAICLLGVWIAYANRQHESQVIE